MGIKAFITGLAGTEVTPAEQNFLYQEHPWGLILFARNIEDKKQVRKLVDQFRDAVGRADAPVLIDQEGGRVQRFKPPVWPKYASGEVLGNLWRSNRKAGERAIYLQSRLMAYDLKEVGINVDCLPVLDVPSKDGHDVIGDRAYSTNPSEVAKMGRFACQGLLAGGVLPVVKHIPGHGRASADSHLELPNVDASLKELRATDFLPFRALNDMPMAMTAHVRYQSLDDTNCATVSKTIIENIIRGEIGFNGLLMSDDLSMQALEGDFTERSQACFKAGCDMLLHCNGNIAEMEEIAAICEVLEGDSLDRANSALEQMGEPDEIDVDALHQELSTLLEAGA